MDKDNMAEKYSYDFSILRDHVSDTDVFDGKTHEKTSDIIHSLLNSENKSITVGLEGAWGAGKSTVIHLLRKKLNEDKDHRDIFFIFDAWAHDGDPLRTIFLESIISCIDPDKKDKHLQMLGDKITSRTKSVKIISEKKASRLGKLLSIFALFVPAGAALLSALDYGELTLPNISLPVCWEFLLGGVLALAPLIFLVIWWLFHKVTKRKSSWAFFEAESTEEYSQDITEDGERTSIEFEKYFKEILGYSLVDGGFTRAVFVIDNLDRVDPEHAKNIWSTLQTFFQGRSSRSEKQGWTDKVWFIVPYDRCGLSRIWKSMDDSDPEEEGRTLTESFMGKCFQVVVEVPQPVLSAWAHYIENIAKKALCGWPSERIDEVIATYKRYFSKLDHSPTPREMSKFVNQVGVLGLRWQDTMSPEAIALYAIYGQKYSREDFRTRLLDNLLPDQYHSVNNTAEIKKELAGMLFGVEKDKGIELLLSPEIAKSLEEGDGDGLLGIYKAHEEAFWIVWRSQRESFFPQVGATTEYVLSATNAVYKAMYNIRSRISLELNRLKQMWETPILEWEPSAYDYSESAGCLIKMLDGNKYLVNKFKQLVVRSINNAIKSISKGDVAGDGLVNIYKLKKLMTSHGVSLERVEFPHSNDRNWIVWTEVLISMGIEFSHVHLSQKSIATLIQNVKFSQPELDASALKSIVYSLKMKIVPLTGWDGLHEAIVSHARLQGRKTGVNDLYTLMVFAITQFSQGKTIIEFVKNAQFWSIASSEDINVVPDLPVLAALCCNKELQSNSHVSPACKAYWSSVSEESKTSICRKLSDLGVLYVVWYMALDERNVKAIDIIRDIDNAGNGVFRFLVGVSHLNQYSWASEDDLSRITRRLCKSGSVKAYFEKYRISTLHDGVLRILHQYGDAYVKRNVDEYLDSISVDGWKKRLMNLSPVAECKWEKKHIYTDAIKSLLFDVLSAAASPAGEFWEKFDGLVEGAMEFDVKVMRPFTRGFFEADEDDLSDEAFDALSHHMVGALVLCDEPNVMIRLENWIDNEQWRRIEWFLGADVKFKESVLDTLRSRIHDGLHSEKRSDNNVLDRLAECLGLSFEPEQTPGDDDSDESDAKAPTE